MTYPQPSRTAVRSVPCPKCFATAGQPCQGVRGDRESNHIERVHHAETHPATNEPRNYDQGPIGRSDCPRCDSVGFIPIDDNGVTRYQPCTCR